MRNLLRSFLILVKFRVDTCMIDRKIFQFKKNYSFLIIYFIKFNFQKLSQLQQYLNQQIDSLLMISKHKFLHSLQTSLIFSYVTPKPHLRNILITAALPYVNNTPHLGNIIGGVLSADVYARYCRMMGYNTFFVCGTDQYGTTTEVKALKEKMSQQQICDKYHKIHAQIYSWFNISFDHFGRTTHPIHTEISQHILSQIYQNKAISQQQSLQFYCEECQMNLADRYVKGTCSNCGSPAKGDQCDGCSTVFKQPTIQLKQPYCSICSETPKIIKTNHIYLKLSEMNQKIQNWISNQNQDSMKFWSKNARGVTKGWLKNKLEDRCISRDLKWGVPVPKNIIQGKVMYVWFQAPLGYISMTAMANPQWKKWWLPENGTSVELNQFMGKDNIMFHSIMAPSTLMLTGRSWVKPHRIAATQYLMFEGGKFSKSNDFGVFGNDCIQIGLKSDVWRYCLLSNRPQTYDSEFTWEYFVTKNNKDLVNTLGNLCQRILKYTKNKFNRIKPKFAAKQVTDGRLTQLDRKFIDEFCRELEEYMLCLEKVELRLGSQKLIELAGIFNKYLQDSQFWDKIHLSTNRNQIIIGLSLNTLHLYAEVIDPYLPETSLKLLQILNCKQKIDFTQAHPQKPLKQIFKQVILGQYPTIQQDSISQPQILFHQINQQTIHQLQNKYGSAKSLT